MSDNIEVRCLMCSKFLRLQRFPDYLYFWRPKGHWYVFEWEREGEIYSALTMLCAKDASYARDNKAVAEAMLAVKLGKLEETDGN